MQIHPHRERLQEADILVGADGIWSAVRAQMYKEGKVKQRSKEGRISGCWKNWNI